MRPTIPASVPPVAAGTQGVSSEVSVSTVADSSAIDRNPDARANPPAPGSSTGDTGTTVSATAVSATQPAAAPPPPPTQQSTVTRTGVDINTASVAELQKLPGVNKLQAQRIFAMRPFLSIQDLIRTGLPQKTINRLKPAATAPAKK